MAVMAVDAVSNNNTGSYTLSGAALGAIGGGAYGYFSKPYLSKGVPNDAFYRTVADKALEAAGEKGAAEKAVISINEALVNAKNADELAKAQADLAINLAEKAVKDSDDAIKAKSLETFKAAVKERIAGVEDAKLPNKAELLKQLDEAKSFSDCKSAAIVDNKIAIEAAEGGFETAKANATKMLQGKVTSFTEKGKSIAEKAFDTGKKEFNLEGLAENTQKEIKGAMKKMQTNAALKWAAIVAVAAGVVGLMISKCSGKSGAIEAKEMKAYQG